MKLAITIYKTFFLKFLTTLNIFSELINLIIFKIIQEIVRKVSTFRI